MSPSKERRDNNYAGEQKANEDEPESKRASQIVHRTGFIMHLQDSTPTSPYLSSLKHWKPFKLVLKGSKLYLYRPPSDKAAGIKELYPTTLVAVNEEELKKGKECELGRRFRVAEALQKRDSM